MASGARQDGFAIELLMKAALDISILTVNFAMMTGVGLSLESRHFAALVRDRWLAPVALIGQMLLLPLIGLATTWVLDLPAHLSAGLLLIAACPVGDIANFYTSLGRANAALSVLVNTLSCLFAALTMACVFRVYSYLAGEQFMFAAPPLQLVIRIAMMTAVPVAVGMLVRRVAPAAARRIGPPIHVACIAGLAGIIVLIIATQANILAAEWMPAATAGIIFMVTALAAGWGLSAIMGLPLADQLTFGVIFSVRNVALAMAVAIGVLGRVEYAAFAVAYFLAEVPLLLGVVAFGRFRLPRGRLAPCSGAMQ